MMKIVTTDPVLSINTLWGWRKGADGPELMVAWDELSVDENLEGFNASCNDAIDSWGDDMQSHRYATITVPYDEIVALWEEEEVTGHVK